MERQKGFGLIGSVAILAVIIVFGVVGWYVLRVKSGHTIFSQQQDSAATLTGIASLWPSAPVCRANESCSAPIANHTIEAVDASGKVEATAKTDGAGAYLMYLNPGRYTLMLEPKVGMGVSRDNTVDVHSGSNNFDVQFDSGIR